MRDPKDVTTVILLKISMVSSGTDLVNNHESLSRNAESQFKFKQSYIENAWAFTVYVTRQLIWKQTTKLSITVNRN